MRSVLALAAVLLALAAPARAEIVDGVGVVVNGDIITLSEIGSRAAQLLGPSGADPSRRKGAFDRAAKDLVAELLVEKEAETQGLKPTDAELDNAIDDVKRTNNIDDATLEKALEQQGLTMEKYRHMLAQQLTRMKLVEVKVKSRVTVSEDDIKARYAQMTANLKGEEELKVRDIFLPFGDDAAAAKAKIEEARKRVAAGEDFAKVAEETGGPLASNGGDLGWVKKGTMLEDIENAAFALKKGEISPILEAGGGFHVVTVEDRRASAGAKPLSDARDEIRQQLLGERLEKATGEYLEELQREAEIEYRLP